MAAQDTLIPTGAPTHTHGARTAPFAVVPDPVTGQYDPGHQLAPDAFERVAGAVAREAFAQMPKLAKEASKGGLVALWVAVFVLFLTQATLGAILYGHTKDGQGLPASVERNSKVLEWLAQCELARQQGRVPPPPPLFLYHP